MNENEFTEWLFKNKKSMSEILGIEVKQNGKDYFYISLISPTYIFEFYKVECIYKIVELEGDSYPIIATLNNGLGNEAFYQSWTHLKDSILSMIKFHLISKHKSRLTAREYDLIMQQVKELE